jgi:hypothetical protein
MCKFPKNSTEPKTSQTQPLNATEWCSLGIDSAFPPANWPLDWQQHPRKKPPWPDIWENNAKGKIVNRAVLYI